MSKNKIPVIKLNNQTAQELEHLSRRQFLKNSTGSLLAIGAASQILPGSATAKLPGNKSCTNGANEAPGGVKRENMLRRYQRAKALEQGSRNKFVFNSMIYPHWISDSDAFWYRRDSRFAKRYRLVDAANVSNDDAFDHKGLARALEQQTGHEVDADNLPITNIDIILSPRAVTFSAFNKSWYYDDEQKRCREVEVYAENWRVSPDGNYAVFVRDYNLWLRNLQTGRERALTSDGEKFKVYAGTSTVFGRQEPPSVEAIWSADSKKVLTLVNDTRDIQAGPPLVKHVPDDGSLRPAILRPDRRMAFAEDDEIEGYQFLAIDINSGQIQRADYHQTPTFYPPYLGFFTAERGWWSDDSRHALYIHQERGGQVARLLEFDTFTGHVRVVIEEKTDTLVSLVPNTHLKPLAQPLPASNELIWYSDRSGWSHLYLYDLRTGKLKNAITSGNWTVRGILHYDPKQRELVIQTSGRVSGRNPYYCDICRVNIDSGKLVTMVTSDHDYVVCDPRSRVSASYARALGVSPNGRYAVATRTRVDQVSVSVLIDRNGNKLLDLETTDISGLPENWQWPEPVMLKAADGETDIYTVVFRPSDFSPDKSYPVVDSSFSYLIPTGSFTSNPFGDWTYLSPAAIAELGFIVVMSCTRGNDFLRNKAFKDYQDPILPLNHAMPIRYNMADSVAAIKQLAQRYPYMDTTRAGVAEMGSVPTGIAGMFLYPEFYKVGVAMFPGSDPGIFGAMGFVEDELPRLEDMADRLRGKLMLIHGMLDDVMPVALTFRLVEALQKANKNFDMLLLPNMGHELPPYAVRRKWDYLVEHLLCVEPPENFDLATGND